MSEKVESKLDEVEADMQEGEAEAGTKPKRAKKVAKKVPKKVKKSKSNGKSESSTEGKVTLADLANEASITTAAARRKLRAAELSREGRWAWDPGSKDLKAARKALELE